PAFVGLQVQREARLVPIYGTERRAVALLFPAPERVASLDRFHLDDLGTQIGQKHAGIRAAQIAGELQHRDILERPRHFSLSVAFELLWLQKQVDTSLVSRNSSSPMRPPSFPRPLCFKPPKGTSAAPGRGSLTPTIPYSSLSAMRRALDKSRV